MSTDVKQILKKHIMTERTSKLLELNNEYVFKVDKKATKYTIKMAIEQAFKVQVDSVRTSVVAGKIRRVGRSEGKTPTWKKAIVRLKAGQSIAIFDNV